MTDLRDPPDLVVEDVGVPIVAPNAPRRRFAVALLVIVASALALRVGIVLAVEHEPLGGDGLGYAWAAADFAEGRYYADPFQPREPFAHHPPAWATVLGSAYAVGFSSLLRLQLLSTVIGAGAVLVVGLLGRQVAGRRVGLIAAAIAGVYPGFWKFERELLSETLALGIVGLVLLLGYRYRAAPSRARALALGAALGLGLLTKADLGLFYPLLALPLVLTAKRPTRERIVQLAMIGGLGLLMAAPWTIYNLGRFEEPVVLSTSLGSAMRIASCDVVFYGEETGYHELGCLIVGQPNLTLDRSEYDALYRRDALEYLGGHLDRLPVVEVARAGRTWSLYRPGQQINFDHAWSLTPIWILWAQLLTYWVLAPLAVVGAGVLRRRRTLVWPLFVPVIGVFITNLAITGEPRYRSPAEVSIVVMAAVAIEAGWRWWSSRGRATRRDRGGDEAGLDLTGAEPEIDLRGAHRRPAPAGGRRAPSRRDPVVPVGTSRR